MKMHFFFMSPCKILTHFAGFFCHKYVSIGVPPLDKGRLGGDFYHYKYKTLFYTRIK